MSDETDDDTIDSEPQTQQVIPAEKVDAIDVDASWDGTVPLDQHRQDAFAKMTQPGFGDSGKAKPDGK